jgi:membrane-bound metal-dependent hydrolase YbcI (DUF457 family)
MPVVGHMLVGLGTAMQVDPAPRCARPLSRAARAAWAPLVVAAAYLPDVLTQIGSMTGVPHARLIGHSFTVGVAAGVLVAAIWAFAARASIVRALAVVVGSILVHDVLDILQATDREPFWPWSTARISTGAFELPSGLWTEGALFLGLFALFLLVRRRYVPMSDTRQMRVGYGPDTRPGLADWLGRGAIAVLVVAAIATHAQRDARARQVQEAWRLVDARRYEDALRTADAAERWPSAAHPGRLDMVRGEAYLGLGDTDRAERAFLRAREQDPTNFWAIVEIAEYYASCNRPASERRRLMQPYVDELRNRFSQRRELPDVLSRLERLMARQAQG